MSQPKPPLVETIVSGAAIMIAGGSTMVDGMLLDAIRRGTNLSPHYAPVEAPELDLRFWIATDALMARDPDTGKWLRLGVSWDELPEMVRLLGGDLMPPTKRLVDAAYDAAPVKTIFRTLVTKREFGTRTKMASLDFARRYNADIDAQLADRDPKPDATTLAAGHDKQWLLHPKLVQFAASKLPAAVNYGGHDSKGRPQQPPEAGHDGKWVDYSQLFRPVKRWAVRLSNPSEKVDLLDWAQRVENVPARFTEPFRGSVSA